MSGEPKADVNIQGWVSRFETEIKAANLPCKENNLHIWEDYVGLHLVYRAPDSIGGFEIVVFDSYPVAKFDAELRFLIREMLVKIGAHYAVMQNKIERLEQDLAAIAILAIEAIKVAGEYKNAGDILFQIVKLSKAIDAR